MHDRSVTVRSCRLPKQLKSSRLRKQAAVTREGRVYHDFQKSKHGKPHLDSKELDKHFKIIEGFSNSGILLSSKFRLLLADLKALFTMIGKYMQELSEAVSNCCI